VSKAFVELLPDVAAIHGCCVTVLSPRLTDPAEFAAATVRVQRPIKVPELRVSPSIIPVPVYAAIVAVEPAAAVTENIPARVLTPPLIFEVLINTDAAVREPAREIAEDVVTNDPSVPPVTITDTPALVPVACATEVAAKEIDPPA
jgi:hypothetical protein